MGAVNGEKVGHQGYPMRMTADPPESLNVKSTIEGFTASLDGRQEDRSPVGVQVAFWGAVSTLAAAGLAGTMALSEGTGSWVVLLPTLGALAVLFVVMYAERKRTTHIEVDAHRLSVKGEQLDATVPLETVIGAHIREYVPGLPWLVVHTSDRTLEILVRGHSRPDAQWLAGRIAFLANEARSRPALAPETLEQADALRKRGSERQGSTY